MLSTLDSSGGVKLQKEFISNTDFRGVKITNEVITGGPNCWSQRGGAAPKGKTLSFFFHTFPSTIWRFNRETPG
jgi:hypothetical protein